jgi:hypothetical protein
LGYRWRHDTRVMAASSFKLTQAHLDAVMQSLKVPTLLLLADHGVAQLLGDMLQWLQQFSIVEQRTVGGSHHFHLEPDAVALIAAQVLAHITAHHETRVDAANRTR